MAEKATRFNEHLTRGRLTGFASAGKKLKDVILEDLKKAIEARYPNHIEVAKEDELQKELDQQEEFLNINSEGLIEREGTFVELDRYLADDSRQLFVLTGPGAPADRREDSGRHDGNRKRPRGQRDHPRSPYRNPPRPHKDP
jgi:hypothetical protein